MSRTYLNWLIGATPTRWWHDSADPAELEAALARGASGVTTNPVLVAAAMRNNRERWRAAIAGAPARTDASGRAEGLVQIAVTQAAASLEPAFGRSPDAGFVCAQVDPTRAGDRDCMTAMARRMHTWAPNIAVKLPATAAGLDVLEDLVAGGITVTSTVSFTVPQVIAIAERHRKGSARARAAGLQPGRCFAVLMIGRLDDYLREVAHDSQAALSEGDIRQCGLAVAKRAYALYREREYAAVLLVAALRGSYHLTELAGADLIMSIHPSYQGLFVSGDLPQETRFDCPVQEDVIDRLQSLPDFIRAYDPSGMSTEEFISYGATQRTLSQFCESWKQLENLR